MKKIKMNSGKLTMLNCCVSFALILVFTISSLTMSERLYDERISQNRRTIEHFQNSFEEETGGIADMMYLCQKNAAFVSVVDSPKYDWNDLGGYVTQTMDMLNVMQSSFYSADCFFLYSARLNKIIGADGYVDADLLSETQWIKNRLRNWETPPDLDTLFTGWHSWQQFVIYALRMHSGGLMMAVLNPRYIADLDGFAKLYPNQHIIVLDKDGRYFASSATDKDAALRSRDFSQTDTGERLELGDVQYTAMRLNGAEFSYLLLTDVNTIEREYRRTSTVMSVLAAGADLLLMILLLLNRAFVGGVRQALGQHWDQSSSELTQIEKMLSENDLWHRQEMENLIRQISGSSEATLTERQRVVMEESFSSYEAVCFAAQCADGIPNSSEMDELVQFLSDSFLCFGIMRDGCVGCLLVETLPVSRIKEAISGYVATLNQDMRLYIGVSNVYTKPEAVCGALRQASRRMMRAPVLDDVLCSEASGERGSERHLSEDECKQIEQLRKDSDVGGMYAFFHSLFERPICLGSMQQLGKEALAAVGVENTETWSPDNCYHPDYLCHKLTETLRLLPQGLESHGISKEQEELSRRVLEYINNHYSEDITLESVADYFHVTAVHMSRWFKKMNDVNFSSYLSAIRMKQARILLAEPRKLKVSEVAMKVGIQSTVTFSRQFKAFFGLSPEQFRRQGDDVIRTQMNETMDAETAVNTRF